MSQTKVKNSRREFMAAGGTSYMLPFYNRLNDVYEGQAEFTVLNREMGFTR